jgi:UrcA family protein
MREKFAGNRCRRMQLVSLALSFLALAASANTEIVGQVTVRYQDLDVQQPKDATVLYQRLRNAARQACLATGSRDLAVRSEEQRCVRAALERAVRSVDKPLVTAAHQRFLAKRVSKAA